MFEEKYEEAISFLLSKGGVAVRYRTLRELCGGTDMLEMEKTKKDLIQCERVNTLLDYMKNRKEYHGGTVLAVENSLNMLVDMGVYYNNGFDKFDEIMDPIIREVENLYLDNEPVFRIFLKIIMVPFLYRAGVRLDWVKNFIEDRICLIHDFISKRSYDIYDCIEKYKSIPEVFRGRSVIKPELYENGNIQFPLDYDIYGFAAIRSDLDEKLKKKVDEIISYILDEHFQAIEDGYGILYKGEKKYSYLSMGWDPKPTDMSKEIKYNPLILKLNQFAHFPNAISSPWFKKAMHVVNQYMIQEGIYSFPKEYLTEKDSIWILGNHMGMGENRRTKDAITVEGTFRMLRIYKCMECCK